MTKAKSPAYIVKFKRRRNKKTDYNKRLKLVKSGKTRAVVRKSNRSILIQFVNFDSAGDRVLYSFNSLSLNKLFGWNAKRNKYTAYISGLHAGTQAKTKGINEFVFDIGRHVPSKGSILFATLKGLLDAGLKTNVNEEILPNFENIPEEVKTSIEKVKKSVAK